MELEIRETELNTRKFHKVIATSTLGLCLPGAPKIRLNLQLGCLQLVWLEELLGSPFMRLCILRLQPGFHIQDFERDTAPLLSEDTTHGSPELDLIRTLSEPHRV